MSHFLTSNSRIWSAMRDRSTSVCRTLAATASSNVNSHAVQVIVIRFSIDELQTPKSKKIDRQQTNWVNQDTLTH
jgi:hypothetical protein